MNGNTQADCDDVDGMMVGDRATTGHNSNRGTDDTEMKIALRFFALMRERIGTGEQEMEFPDDSSVGDVVDWAEGQFADIAPLFRASMVMRNQEYADKSDLLQDGDEIA